jgi:hypothetical protein
MQIDKHLLEAAGTIAVTNHTTVSDEEQLATTKVLSEDPTVVTMIEAAIGKLLQLAGRVTVKDLFCILGTQFEMGFEVGREYERLAAEKTKTVGGVA